MTAQGVLDQVSFNYEQIVEIIHGNVSSLKAKVPEQEREELFKKLQRDTRVEVDYHRNDGTIEVRPSRETFARLNNSHRTYSYCR